MKGLIETSNMNGSEDFRPEGQDLWFSNYKIAEELKSKGNTPPGTIIHQNLGHNSKKEGLGPNTKR